MRVVLSSLAMLCGCAMLAHVGLMLVSLSAEMARFGGIPWSADFLEGNWEWVAEAATGLVLAAAGLIVLLAATSRRTARFPPPPSPPKG